MTLVSEPKPTTPTDIDPALAHPLLQEMIAQLRDQLLEPWRKALARSPDIGAEMDRTVATLQVFFSKWVVEIIMVLGQGGTLRFNELKQKLSGISSRTLAQRLRDLEEQGIVRREMFDEMPVRVEYTLTSKGTDVAALALPLVLYLRTR